MKNARTKHLDFILGDILALGIAYGLAVLLHLTEVDRGALGVYGRLGVLLSVILVMVVFFTDGYRGVLYRGYGEEILSAACQMALIFGLEIVFLFIFQLNSVYSRKVLFVTPFFGFVMICIERSLMKAFLRRRFQKVKHARTLMIIATADQARILIQHILAHPLTIFKIAGIAIIDKDMKGQKILNIPVTASQNEIMEYVSSHVVDEVLISIPGNPKYEAALAREFLAIGLVAHIYMEQYLNNMPNRVQERISDMNVTTCYNCEVPLWMSIGKSLLDFAGGVVGTIFAILLGLIIGPMIYLKSPGPIIFSQVRVGKNGRKFKIYKFRSMYMDAEKRKAELMAQNKCKGNMFKMDNDPRIIPGVGHFIRKFSLDEFPQFINVLKGDMSLVGTRPPTVDEYEAYSFYQNKRLAMKPGITGMWQVSGRSNITDFDEVVKLDSDYIDGWTIDKDIKILLKTIGIIFSCRGSV